MSKFAGLLEEGACYRIRNFGVGENGGKYPLLPHKYKINFFKNTSLTRINRFDTNHNGFKFEPFLRFTTRRWTEQEAVGMYLIFPNHNHSFYIVVKCFNCFSCPIYFCFFRCHWDYSLYW